MFFFGHNITQKALFASKTKAWRVTLNITLGLSHNITKTAARTTARLYNYHRSYYHNYYHAKILSEKKPAGAGLVQVDR